MAAHNFTFEGGEILTGMGASWFVSYAYYEKIDRTHMNWSKVATTQPRISKYNKGKPYHRIWLEEVISMNPANLNKNTIGLDASQTKRMAKELLNLMD
ncbi:MAG: hypothetical protein Q4A54_09150 [Parabacteroides sp.]|nr:hypothetical protein [Parabacteroides sp.]